MLNASIIGLSLWALPPSVVGGAFGLASLFRPCHTVDWDGAMLISTSLALLSYEHTVVTGTDAESTIRQPIHVALLCISLFLLSCFFL